LEDDFIRNELGITKRAELLRLICEVVAEKISKLPAEKHVRLSEAQLDQFVKADLKVKDLKPLQDFLASVGGRELGLTSEPSILMPVLRDLIAEVNPEYARLSSILKVTKADLKKFVDEHKSKT
jgi:hypothetical protein